MLFRSGINYVAQQLAHTPFAFGITKILFCGRDGMNYLYHAVPRYAQGLEEVGFFNLLDVIFVKVGNGVEVEEHKSFFV